MNCPNCGRELAEGEVCNCTATNENVYQPPVPEQTQYAPVQEPHYAPVSEQQYVPAQEQPQYYVPPIGAPEQNYYNPQQPMPPVQPAQPVVARTDYPEGYKIKKKVVAVVLASGLGALGIHNFYLGNTNKAIAQLLVCLVGSLFAGLGLVAAIIWATVDAVLLFTEKTNMDANGFKIMTFEESMAKAIKESNKEDEAEEE